MFSLPKSARILHVIDRSHVNMHAPKLPEHSRRVSPTASAASDAIRVQLSLTQRSEEYLYEACFSECGGEGKNCRKHAFDFDFSSKVDPGSQVNWPAASTSGLEGKTDLNRQSQ